MEKRTTLKRLSPIFVLAALWMFNAIAMQAQRQIEPTYLSTSEGLASPTVEHVFQDSYGLLWIGTSNGLQKYDGYRFENFKNSVGKTNSLQDNNVFGIIEDANRDIWVCSAIGVSRYNRKRNEFINYRFSNTFSDVPVGMGMTFQLFIDSQKKVWATTRDIELVYFDQPTNEWKLAPYEIDNAEQSSHLGLSLAITEDASGGLWSGSSNYGLMHRKKGELNFKPVPREQVGGINFVNELDHISALYFDTENTLWITTRRGVHKYNPATGQFKTIKEYDEGTIDNWTYLNAIIQDKEGNVWITNNFRGILKFEGVSDRYEEISIAGKVYMRTHGWSTALSNMIIDKSGIFWIGSRESGLLKYDPINKPFSVYKHDNNDVNSISPHGVFGIATSRLNPDILYVGTRGGGVNIFDSKTQNFREVKFNVVDDRFGGSARSIAEDPDGSLWVGTWGDGLIKTDQNYREVKRFKYEAQSNNSISGNLVRNIKFDKQGRLWVGTDNGLNILDKKSGTFERVVSGDTKLYPRELVNAIEKLLKSDQRIGIIDHVKNSENRSLPIEIKAAGTYAVISVGEGYVGQPADVGWIENAFKDTIWIASDFEKTRHAGGATKNRITIDQINLQPGSYTLRFRTDDSHSFDNWNENPPDQTNIYGMGLARLQDVNSLKAFENPITEDRPQIVLLGDNIADFEVGEKYIWVASNNKGLNKIDPSNNTVTYFTHDAENENSLSSNVITDVLEDSKKMVWIATDNGINKLDPGTGKITRYLEMDGLPTNLTSNILEGENGEMWISTENGIAQMVVNEKLGKVTFINYNSTDGLGADSFLPLAATKTKNGRFYFGGDHGLTTFSTVTANRTPPDLLISNLFISNKSVLDMGENSPLKDDLLGSDNIVLGYDQNNLSFEFSALHYANPKKNQYAHMLKGYDHDWIYDNRNFASYTNLDPGEYDFLIRASNAYGIWNEQGKSFKITILPPWWRTWWAYGAYVCLFSLVAFGVDRLIRRNIRMRERERNRENDLKHAKEIEVAYTNLKATQAQLVQSEKMASLGELTAGIAHEIQNPLNFVNNFSEVNQELIQEMDDEIKAGNYTEVRTLAQNIADNEKKIIFHGKRADAIVKGMLQHSRSSSGQKELTDINAIADEYLRLAYHGLRAKNKTFNATMTTDFDQSIGKIDVIPQDIGRVILNLITNAFYVVSEKKSQNNGHAGTEKYEPTVTVSTKRTGSGIEIKVKDNGNGIPKAILDKIFQPFFTTKPSGEGTGLGLSLSYDIVTKGHGGKLLVDTKEGEGTEFVILLPVV